MLAATEVENLMLQAEEQAFSNPAILKQGQIEYYCKTQKWTRYMSFCCQKEASKIENFTKSVIKHSSRPARYQAHRKVVFITEDWIESCTTKFAAESKTCNKLSPLGYYSLLVSMF